MILAPLDQLVDALSALPGIGKKTARRLAFFLVDSDTEISGKIVDAINQCNNLLGKCPQCGLYSIKNQNCSICSSENRNRNIICVVSRPQDVIAIESSHGFNGVYHILGGNIAPLDGIGPEDLTIDRLLDRISSDNVNELIFALDNTVDGETTSHYLAAVVPQNVTISRIAAGIPFGGELEYTDGVTISRALEFRTQYKRL
ncbi:MAG: recombination protein RecR [Deltaproteobacteria bacterium]|nr:recombination protein RecR [Deltaproteobacteria bacterium]